MALSLNTSHPLYSNLVSLIGVDDDNTVKDFVVPARTCTKHANATLSTGTYGRHVRTTHASGDSQGVALSSKVPYGTATDQNSSVFVVLNSLLNTSGHSRSSLLGQTSITYLAPAITVNATKNVGQGIGAGLPDTYSTANIASGAHSIAVTRTHQTSGQLILDGSAEVVNYGRVGNTDNLNGFDQIGGHPSGSWGAVSADFVWIATFNKVLSEAEVADLHTSLGSGNAFGLVLGGGGTDATAPGATLTGTSSISAGSASGGAGGSDATAPGATLTGTSSISAGTASGGGGAGSFTSDAMENNTGAGLLASTSVTWTWWKGAIGATPTSLTHGTGTTSAGGVLSLTGLPTGAGFLLVRTADSVGVYYQPGTVT